MLIIFEKCSEHQIMFMFSKNILLKNKYFFHVFQKSFTILKKFLNFKFCSIFQKQFPLKIVCVCKKWLKIWKNVQKFKKINFSENAHVFKKLFAFSQNIRVSHKPFSNYIQFCKIFFYEFIRKIEWIATVYDPPQCQLDWSNIVNHVVIVRARLD